MGVDRRRVAPALLVVAAACGGASPVPAAQESMTGERAATAAAVAMDPIHLTRIDSVIEAAIADGATPGAALAIGRHGRLVRLRGYGELDHDPASNRALPTSIYDVASLTKVVGTTTAIMMLVDDGTLALDDRVVEHLPGWDRGDDRKADVTIRHLLLHRSGLAPFRRWFFEIDGRGAYTDAIYDEALESDPGAETAYSDIGAMTLGLIVEAVSGQALDAFLERRLFGPAGMSDTGFLPAAALLPRIAPTENDTTFRMRHIHGEVHDENAHAFGGVAGHAGLFSTAADLAVFAELMIRGGELPACEPGNDERTPCPVARPYPIRLLDEATVRLFTARADTTASRALGWDTPSGRSSAGDYFTENAFGHTGFTGTSIWIDPELDLWVVLLTNRVNPTRENSGHVPLRRAVHDLAATAITDRPVPRRESSN